jgi:hypothetical protein
MKITLCGSTRFMEQYHAWNRWLTLQGHAVYSVAGSAKDGWNITDDEKETLDLVHLVKILNSDAILVINCLLSPEDPFGEFDAGPLYTGESTKREIKWAEMLGRMVTYTSYVQVKDQLKAVDWNRCRTL